MLKPENFGNVINCTLHHFLDACESGYDLSSYIRLLNESGQVHCTLLIGKSRVVPFKFVSIPKLQLTAGTVSVISKMLKNELDIHFDVQIFWTDSKVVLGYINSDARRFKVFVANRVQQIRDHTSNRIMLRVAVIQQMMPHEDWVPRRKIRGDGLMELLFFGGENNAA